MNKSIIKNCNEYTLNHVTEVVDILINAYNTFDFNASDCLIYGKVIKNKEEMYMYVLSNCPLAYELWMGISTNYLQLKTIRQQRRTHKLREWREFCKWIDTLPYFQELTNKNYKK